jgi:hypothetical protein
MIIVQSPYNSINVLRVAIAKLSNSYVQYFVFTHCTLAMLKIDSANPFTLNHNSVSYGKVILYIMFFTCREIIVARFLKERVYSVLLLYTHPNLKTLKALLLSGEKE